MLYCLRSSNSASVTASQDTAESWCQLLHIWNPSPQRRSRESKLFPAIFTNKARSSREFFQIIAQLIREASYEFLCTSRVRKAVYVFFLHFTGALRWQRRLYDKQQTCFIAHFTITASRLRVFLTPHEQPAIYTIFCHLKRNESEKVESSLIVRSHYSPSSLVNTKTFGAVSFLRCTDVVIDCTARRTLGNNNRRQKHGIVKMKVMSVIQKCNRRKVCSSGKFKKTYPYLELRKAMV